MRFSFNCVNPYVLVGLLAACSGCPRVPDDALEPNDTPETATPLNPGQPIEARAVQDDLDVFVVQAGPDQSIVFTFEHLGDDNCAAFTVTDPDSQVLYQDNNRFCGREFSTPTAVEGASLQSTPAGGSILRVPAVLQGQYLLTVEELGEVDNVFDFVWRYRLTAALE
jgi:hypothetical protein